MDWRARPSRSAREYRIARDRPCRDPRPIRQWEASIPRTEGGHDRSAYRGPLESHRLNSSYPAGVAIAVSAVFLFSLKGIFAKFAYAHGVDAVSMMGLRMGFALPFFVAVALWSRRGVPPLASRDLLAVVGLSVLGYYCASLLDFIGLEYVTASVERLLLFSYPTMVVLLSAFFFKRAITSRDIVSLVLTYAGVALVITGGAVSEQRDIVKGALFVVASAALYSVYLVFGSATIKRVGAMRFTAYGMLAASFPAIVQWLVLRPSEPLSLPTAAYGWCLALAIFSTVLPIFLQSAALKRIGANDFSMIGALGPVATIFVGHLLLTERMSPLQWAGAALVVAGVMIVTLKAK